MISPFPGARGEIFEEDGRSLSLLLEWKFFSIYRQAFQPKVFRQFLSGCPVFLELVTCYVNSAIL